MLTITGPGIPALVHGLLGILVGIESFFGSIKYDLKTIFRSIVFLFASVLVSLVFGTLSLIYIDEYCSTAINVSTCTSSTRFIGLVYIIGGVLVTAFFAILTMFFYRNVARTRLEAESKHDLFHHRT